MCCVTADEAKAARYTTSTVAALLGVSQATVTRIPKGDLDYWTTPRGHRRYRIEDVRRYVREHLGMEISEPGDDT